MNPHPCSIYRRDGIVSGPMCDVRCARAPHIFRALTYWAHGAESAWQRAQASTSAGPPASQFQRAPTVSLAPKCDG